MAIPWFRVFPPEPQRQHPFGFDDNAGPRNIPAQTTSPYAYFSLIFNMTLIREIVRQTNTPDGHFKPLLDFVNRMFKKYYVPQREVSVDETLVGTRGRTAMLQYIPTKSHKFGVKFWVLAESCSGYVVDMCCYLGKVFQPSPVGENQGTRVVLDLLHRSNLLEKGYHVVCDSFFCCVDLAKRLLEQGTYLTGTLRSNRKMPVLIKDAPVGPGETVYMRQGNVLTAAYKNQRNGKKAVRLLSTLATADRRHGMPDIVKSYNKNMGGVDEADMLMSFYSNNRKSVRVWKKMVIHIISRVLLNSYVLYHNSTTERPVKSRLRFCQEVVEGLANDHIAARRTGIPRPREEVHRQPILLEKLPGRKERDCSVCSDRQHSVRRRCKTRCTRCKAGVHKLCVARHVCTIIEDTDKLRKTSYVFQVMF
ncbi:piggyBac transposable element-derived protein 4-like [Argopecten irradians]|uniref:piggyBac transposable element-derived protein 4-like n=1 Tax=Argopecten irradians TaxID=31199 RepID=UPI0037187924